MSRVHRLTSSWYESHRRKESWDRFCYAINIRSYLCSNIYVQIFFWNVVGSGWFSCVWGVLIDWAMLTVTRDRKKEKEKNGRKDRKDENNKKWWGKGYISKPKKRLSNVQHFINDWKGVEGLEMDQRRGAERRKRGYAMARKPLKKKKLTCTAGVLIYFSITKREKG